MANEITKNIENGEIIELLSKVGEIIKNNNTPFNVFEIINVCEKEVRMCMFFAELLNPLGSHNMNRCYFDLFFNTVLKGKFREFKNPIITKEEVSYDSYRRMDIVISDEESKQYVPIEVKINADERINQVSDYLDITTEKLKKYKDENPDENAKLIYLTKYGIKPKYTKTMNNICLNKIICISWYEDIVNWLDKCIEITNDTIIKSTIIQYKTAIERFTQKEEYKIMENLFIESDDAEKNLICAQKLVKALNKAEQDIWTKFTKEIETNIKDTYNQEPCMIDIWKIKYHTSKNEYINIGSDKKDKVEFRIMKEDDIWKNGVPYEEETFDFTDLANPEKFVQRVQQCVEFIKNHF